MNTSARCHNCGTSKPADNFRACGKCREEWRRASRKHGGPAETVERLTEALTLIERVYYMEDRDSVWRAGKMNAIARDAQDGKDLAPHRRLFPRGDA